MKPALRSKDQLLAYLTDIIEGIKADDSFEGPIQYSATPTKDQFEVIGFWRVDNSECQGGS